jgi:hypothetical protein
MRGKSWKRKAIRPEIFFALGLGLLQLVGYQIEDLRVC